MPVNGHFINSGIHELLEKKNYRAVDMVLPIIGAYINCTTRFQNDANRTCLHRMCSNMKSKPLSRNYERGYSVVESDKNYADKFVGLNTRLQPGFGFFTHPDYLR